MSAFTNMFVATAFALVLFGISQTSAADYNEAVNTYGMPCHNDNSCIGENLVCEYNQCVCRQGYADVDNGVFVRCVRVPAPTPGPTPVYSPVVVSSATMIQPAIAILVALFAFAY